MSQEIYVITLMFRYPYFFKEITKMSPGRANFTIEHPKPRNMKQARITLCFLCFIALSSFDSLSQDNIQAIAAIVIIALIVVLTITFIKQKAAIKKHKIQVEAALRDFKAVQDQLVHSEKMSSLGQLTAGLLHEINNPVNFIQSAAEILQEKLIVIKKVEEAYESCTPDNFKEQFAKTQALKEQLEFNSTIMEFEMLVKTIRTGAVRTSSIIHGLGRFASKRSDDFSEILIREPVEDTLILIRTELKNGIDVVTNFHDGLSVSGRTGELQQVFLNILMNACQAMEGKGRIVITTAKCDTGKAIISIKDSGPGISREVQSKIFEPFFTTKKVGKGMGLGLSITNGIIKGHNGNIEVVSDGKNGTEFIISLPAR